ncbi:hypothetical protein [Streptomyces sp. NPDC058847]
MADGRIPRPEPETSTGWVVGSGGEERCLRTAAVGPTVSLRPFVV